MTPSPARPKGTSFGRRGGLGRGAFDLKAKALPPPNPPLRPKEVPLGHAGGGAHPAAELFRTAVSEGWDPVPPSC